MVILSVKSSFDSSHQLAMVFPPPHKCSNVHGHSWNVQININTGNTIVDFRKFKDDVNSITDQLDHGTLNDIIEVPICEVITSWIAARIRQLGYQLESVTVSETKNNIATFVQKDHPAFEIHKLQMFGYKPSDIEFKLKRGEIYDYSRRYKSESRVAANGYSYFNVPIAQDIIEAYQPGMFEMIGDYPWQYMITYIDGDAANCDYSNLRLIKNADL